MIEVIYSDRRSQRGKMRILLTSYDVMRGGAIEKIKKCLKADTDLHIPIAEVYGGRFYWIELELKDLTIAPCSGVEIPGNRKDWTTERIVEYLQAKGVVI